MQKAKVYAVVGSNIEQLGTELERKCKETAAATETEWHKTGKAPGLLIWRVENFKVVPVPPKTYGLFFEGDSYIVLNTHGRPGSFLYDVHFWLGDSTTLDEAGTAVYKTIELDTYLKDVPVQHREVQGHESPLFLSYFPNGVRILEGGVASGFQHVSPTEYKPRLLQLKGRRTVRAQQVPLSRDSLNSGDVFILDNGLTLYQWNGSKSSGQERIKAAQLCRAIDDEREGKPRVVVMEENDNDPEKADFWALLGGFGPVKSAEAGGHDDEAPKAPKKLFKLSDASGRLEFTELASGTVRKNLLNNDDVFLFDTGAELFVWVGKGASQQEKARGMAYAQDYVKRYNRPDYLPITRLFQGGENEVWEASFDH